MQRWALIHHTPPQPPQPAIGTIGSHINKPKEIFTQCNAFYCSNYGTNFKLILRWGTIGSRIPSTPKGGRSCEENFMRYLDLDQKL